MADNKDSIMIALLPIVSDWCRIELPHLTLVYAGKIGDMKKPSAFNEIAKDASLLATLSRPLTLRTMGTDVFGGRGYDEEVDVIRLRPSQELAAMRRVVEHWNASEYPFTPHVTIGPAGQGLPDIPSHIAFNQILLAWGETHLVFSLTH